MFNDFEDSTGHELPLMGCFKFKMLERMLSSHSEVLLRQLVVHCILVELGYPWLPHDGVFKIEYIGMIMIII